MPKLNTTPKAMSLDEKELVKFIADKLNSFGFIEAKRKCYTPKYGDDAYTIEDWDARTVGIFLAQDLLSLFSQWADEQRVAELENAIAVGEGPLRQGMAIAAPGIGGTLQYGVNITYLYDRIKTLTGGDE